MCQRLEETLVKKEKLRVSAQNVKLLQQKLKLSQPLLPIRKHSKDYDSSQTALNIWLKENPVGQRLNGGREEKYKMELGAKG